MNFSSDPIIVHPLYIFCADTSLKNKVFNQMTNLIVSKSSNNGSLQTETTTQTSTQIEHSTSFPSLKLARSAKRPSPGSNRSITSPKERQSYLQEFFDLIFNKLMIQKSKFKHMLEFRLVPLFFINQVKLINLLLK